MPVKTVSPDTFVHILALLAIAQRLRQRALAAVSAVDAVDLLREAETFEDKAKRAGR